jgi:hypothetical protein
MTTAVITKGELLSQKMSVLKSSTSYTVTDDSGDPEFFLLPVTPELVDLMEEYEMILNKDSLQKELQKSHDSGFSSLVI